MKTLKCHDHLELTTQLMLHRCRNLLLLDAVPHPPREQKLPSAQPKQELNPHHNMSKRTLTMKTCGATSLAAKMRQ